MSGAGGDAGAGGGGRGTPETDGSGSDAFDELFKRELQAVRDRVKMMDLDKMVEAGRKVLASGDRSGLEAMQQEAIDKSTAANREQLLKLWDVYDADHNGELSKQENRKLAAAYFKASRKWLPQLLVDTMESACAIGLRMAASMSGEEVSEGMKADVQAGVESMRPRIEAVTLQMLDSVDVDQFADAALREMDTDHDGKVTRDEFASQFINTMNKLFNPEQLLNSIKAAMGLP